MLNWIRIYCCLYPDSLELKGKIKFFIRLHYFYDFSETVILDEL